MRTNNFQKLLLVAMILFFVVVNVSRPLNAFDLRVENAVILECDGYTSLIETIDGHMWLVDGYDLAKDGTCFVVFNTMRTENVIDDAVISVIETN